MVRFRVTFRDSGDCGGVLVVVVVVAAAVVAPWRRSDVKGFPLEETVREEVLGATEEGPTVRTTSDLRSYTVGRFRDSPDWNELRSRHY